MKGKCSLDLPLAMIHTKEVEEKVVTVARSLQEMTTVEPESAETEDSDKERGN